MPAPKGETKAQRVARLRAKANELSDKATLARVMGVLTGNRDVLLKVERDLVRDGVLEPDESFTPKKVEPLAMLEDGSASAAEASEVGAEHATTNASASSGPVQAVTVGGITLTDTTPYDRNHSQFGDLGVLMLMAVMRQVEPISMSKENLGRLRAKGQRVIPKPKLIELMEFGFNIKRSDTIEMGIRHNRGVAEFLVARYESDGCKRLHNLQLPVDFSEPGQGWFTVRRVDGTQAHLKRNDTGQCFCIDDVPRGVALYIHQNWSVEDAVLRQKSGTYMKRLLTVLPAPDAGAQGIPSRPPAKRATRALAPPPHADADRIDDDDVATPPTRKARTTYGSPVVMQGTTPSLAAPNDSNPCSGELHGGENGLLDVLALATFDGQDAATPATASASAIPSLQAVEPGAVEFTEASFIPPPPSDPDAEKEDASVIG